jgi:MtrB/PioB family decaheme-associated outer membrane protein
MKNLKYLAAWISLVLFLLPVGLLAQDKTTDHGSVEFGLRYDWGDVTGRPDLLNGQCVGCGAPFQPALNTSKFSEYRDLRNGFYVRRMDVKFENILNSRKYVSLKTNRTLYRDQSYLATLGDYGKFKLQFRYDEIPHTYSNTTRTLFTQTAPGVWSFPALLRQALQASTPANLPNLTNTQLIPQFNAITPSILRKAGTASFSFDVNSDWNLNALFFRESQRGMRPIGLIMNPSPSASVTGGYGVELPEPINYFNNTLRFGTEYGKRSWGIQAAYIGSFFQNRTKTLFFDNPFRLTSETLGNPLTGRMALYPDNKAQSLNFAGATDLGKYLRLTGSIAPGWLRQNEPYVAYTTNSANVTCGDGTQLCTSLSSLPALSLAGSKQTLAMNYTLVTTAWKSVEAKAAYRHYDYNNNTPVYTFTPVQGDAGTPPLTPTDNTPFGYNRKNVELSADWFFMKRSDFKIAYEAEWMDRVHRDAAHSLENTVTAAVDFSPTKDWLIRLSYRHADRKPDVYLDDVSQEISGAIPVDSPYARRFDEAARLRNKADGLIQYNFTDKLSVSAFGSTLQDDFNRAGESNNATALNFLTGSSATTNPYYLYGVLKDISNNYGFDVDYAILPEATLFAEYSRESYHKRMVTRYRAPESTSGTGGCGPNSLGSANRGACDSANNDWESTSREMVDIYSSGVDFTFGKSKKIYLTTYYSLAAVKGNVFSRYLGDPVGHPNLPVANDPARFMLVGTNAAVDYPETVNRTHEISVLLKFKITDKLTPKFEYRYQRWDNKDYQTSAMTQYMGCVSPIPNGPPVTNAVPGCTTPVLTSNSPTPVSVVSPYYPYTVVGDPSAARFLFLGVDQPSYRAHFVSATLEYRF